MDKSKYTVEVQEWMKVVEKMCEQDTELTLRYCDNIITYGTTEKDDSLIAFGYYYKGVAFYVINDGLRFYGAVTNALSYLHKAEEWELMARCYNFLGISSVNRGNAAVALDYYLNAIDCCKKAKSGLVEATVQTNIGALYILCGRYADALECLEYAYDYFNKHPEHPNYDNYMVCIYENMAKAYLYKEKLIEAKCCFERIYSEHAAYCDESVMVTVHCIEAMYYHAAGDDEKCEKNISLVYKKTSDKMSIMDMFDDYYDFCKVLLERDKEKEFWYIISIIEPLVKSLDMVSLYRRVLGLKLKLYRKKKQNEEYMRSSVLFFELSERAEVENKTMMNNVLTLRKTLERVSHEKKEIEAQNKILQKKSETDALTGLSNRFRLNEYFEEVFQRALTENKTLTVEILDIDFFKEYNDGHGHQLGDECIRRVASMVQSMEEFGAFTARYGGDEFILIYEGITKEQATEYAAELRNRVINLQIEHPLSKVSKCITISQGICLDVPLPGNSMWDYLRAADDMLYRVKQKKRNNFCIGNLIQSGDQIIMSYL